MNWQDDHEQRISKFPDDVRRAHEHSSNHRFEILGSAVCGCFYCKAVFPPGTISDWVDDDAAGVGQTALCPKCGIDTVVGDKSGFEISSEFLTEMNKYWF